MENTRLSSSVTIGKYRQFEANENREEIAKFILERFTERYITPLLGDTKKKHGFCIMAISCLMIEALESFRQGWCDTNGKSKKAFESFFQHCGQDSKLNVFSEHANDFHKGV